MAISGSTLVVGTKHGTTDTGKAYVFTGSGTTWSQQATLADPAGNADDQFGFSHRADQLVWWCVFQRGRV